MTHVLRGVRRAGPLQRVIGYLPRRRVASDEGLRFDGVHAVHTLGLRAALDIALLDAHGTVVRIERNVRAGRPLVLSHRSARSAVETGAGGLAAIAPGDRIVTAPD